MPQPFSTVRFPSLFFAPSDRGGSANSWHTLGLCSQVQDVLSCLLAGECSDERLWDVSVISVEPIAGTNRLLVRVAPSNPSTPLNAWEILSALKAARSYFRREIATEIHRKRVPDLEFAWLLPEEVTRDE